MRASGHRGVRDLRGATRLPESTGGEVGVFCDDGFYGEGDFYYYADNQPGQRRGTAVQPALQGSGDGAQSSSLSLDVRAAQLAPRLPCKCS